jgi:hypothetical protein
MPYHPKTIEKIKRLPMSSLGARLGRWAVYHDIPVARFAQLTGATRQTAHNWIHGGEVFVAYRPMVERIVKTLEQTKLGEDAWSKLCQEFDLRY